ncbi:GTPase IMAP family member 7-like isoform X2 [Cololabis saira]|uniref:GTPase IMAP family member 7-like isoform X2 n=1 Tax=Cololabis saira TaxID=129043 RepID=UPI002AD5847D|nr:GTPase IMAP family member 7-like isoform X2 [Cololabis saira]
MSSENAVSQAESEPLRMILLGRTGTGRSSSGNTIFGRSAFWVEASPRSITTKCRRQTGTVGGRPVSIVDTPGFFHTNLSPQEVMAEVGQCIRLYPPGPHIFLVTVQLGRFTQEERETLEWIKAMFGSEVSRFIMVLFTWGDQLQGKCIEDFLEESQELSEFVHGCHGRYHIFDNSGQDETSECSQKVMLLLKKVDVVVTKNGGGFYTSEMFKEAQNTIKEAQERILGEKGQKLEVLEKETGDKEEQSHDSEMMRREEEEARKRAEKLFWCELVTAIGRGAAEGAGIIGKEKGKGKAVKKVAALAASPLNIKSVVGGAVREGSKVLSKHKKTLLH